MTKAPAIFAQVCKSHGLPEPVAEYRFHSVRKWRMDWAFPAFKVALEIDGGVWTGGAHGRGTGIVRDQEKHNYAACMGWITIRCVPKDMLKSETFAFLKAAMKVNATKTPSP